MRFRRKPKGGVGSNQYQSRGEPHQHSGCDHMAVGTAVIGSSLMSQVEPSRDKADRKRCGEIWADGCRHWVYPPGYDHDNHPTTESMVDVTTSEDTSIPVLECLSHSDMHAVRVKVAGNKSAPGSALRRLALDSEEMVRYMAAMNPGCPLDALDQLGHDVVPEVRRALARNRAVQPSVLERLALDSDSYVRYNVAGNPMTPVPVLARLSAESDQLVVRAASHNPSLPEHIRALASVIRPLNTL